MLVLLSHIDRVMSRAWGLRTFVMNFFHNCLLLSTCVIKTFDLLLLLIYVISRPFKVLLSFDDFISKIDAFRRVPLELTSAFLCGILVSLKGIVGDWARFGTIGFGCIVKNLRDKGLLRLFILSQIDNFISLFQLSTSIRYYIILADTGILGLS